MHSNGQAAIDGGTLRPAIDWATLLSQHDRWLRTAVYARLREAEGVDEVMQAIAVAAIEQRAPLLDLSKAAPWLYRLAIWQTLQYRRRAGRQRKLIQRFGACSAVDSDRAPPADRVDPLHWLLSNERNRLVREAVDRLPRQEAEILLLKYTEEWSYRELAAHLGISESAVEARLHRARVRLRNELAAGRFDGDSK